MTKISKILLPLSTAAITVASIAPVASCGGVGAVDLLTYAPNKDLVCKKSALTEPGATDEIFKAENAIDILKQDILTYLSGEIKNELYPALYGIGGTGWVGPVHSSKCVLSNLKFTYDDKAHEARLSGTIRLQAICDVVQEDLLGSHKIGTYKLETKHEIHNMPYRFVHTRSQIDPEGVYGTTYQNREELNKDQNWFVNRSYTGKATYDKSGVKPEQASDAFKFDANSLTKDNFDELSLIRGGSYYLNNVALG